MAEDADAQLMTVVNSIGLVLFTLLVGYHLVTATRKDAE